MTWMRSVLHVIITLAVVLHGAWMAMMPFAHAADAPLGGHADPAVTLASHSGHHAETAHDPHAGHHGGAHGDHATAHHPQSHDTAHHRASGHHTGDTACADGADHGSDHDMAGCDCTLCKPVSLAAADIKPGLNRPVLRDQAVRLDPAQQPRSTTGPPVGLRAPPTLI